MIEEFKRKLETFSPTPEALWEIRGDVLALKALLEGRRTYPKREEAIELALGLSGICNDFYKLLNNLRRKLTAKGYTQIATLWDMATVGSLAMHDLMDGKWMKVKNLLTSAFSEGAMVMASVQYIKASDENLMAMVDDHLSDLYGHMWDLVGLTKGGGGLSPKKVKAVKEGLDRFFKGLVDDDASIEVTLMIMVQLYIVIVQVRSKRLLELLDERGLGLD